jgi:hypothetical protein
VSIRGICPRFGARGAQSSLKWMCPVIMPNKIRTKAMVKFIAKKVAIFQYQTIGKYHATPAQMPYNPKINIGRALASL